MPDNPTPDAIPVPGRPEIPPTQPPTIPEIPRPQEPITPYPAHPEPAPTPQPPTKPGPEPPGPRTSGRDQNTDPKEDTMPAQVELITWESSLEQAEKRAAREDKFVLVDFSAAPE